MSTRDQTVPSRSRLLSLLSEACELEHGLACSYLFSAFTLKQDLSEGGITWQQLQMARRWAADLYFVASEEMLHLAQAWNVLAAVGGMPYYLRPNFPQSSKYYPLNAQLVLEPFGELAISRFIFYERPRALEEVERAQMSSGTDNNYTTVGELYTTIRKMIEQIPEEQLFIGQKANQVGPELVDFPDLIKVDGRETAFAAIDMITEQGEGSRENTVDCHFGVFRRVLEELRGEAAQSARLGTAFAPARCTVPNPVSKVRGSVGLSGGTLITNDDTRRLGDAFDDTYELMLRMLQFVFDDITAPSELVRKMARQALLVMVQVVKPLGEALTLSPAGTEYPELNAGPGFGLTRHVSLPRDQCAAEVVVRERIDEVCQELETLRLAAFPADRVSAAIRNLRQIKLLT